MDSNLLKFIKDSPQIIDKETFEKSAKEAARKEVEYKLKTPEISGAGGIKLSLDYVAFFDTNSDNTMFMATLINDQDATVYGG